MSHLFLGLFLGFWGLGLTNFGKFATIVSAMVLPERIKHGEDRNISEDLD